MSGLQRYRIEQEIGRGAMGVVYRAYDLTLERPVALKELTFAAGTSEGLQVDMIERFQREARAAARLAHPNVVQVFDVFDDGDRHFIAMELLEGQSLGDALDGGGLSAGASVGILLEVLDALAAAHRAGIVHRDIKPDNIFLLDDGRVKVADFGIAKVLDGGAANATQMGTLIGTPGYMSPEQILGQPVDGRSDLFSLGVVGYETLSGRNPFWAEATTTMMFRIANEMPPPIPEMKATGPIAAVVARSLEKNPDARYSSAQEMADDLRRAAGGAMPAAGGSGVQPAPASGRSVSSGLVAALVALGIAAAVGFWMFSGSGTTGSVVSNPVPPGTSSANGDLVVIQPDGGADPAAEPSAQAASNQGSPGAPSTPFWGAFFYANERKSAARAKADELESAGYPALVLDTADYDSIGKPGQSIWVVCSGPYATKSEAQDAASGMKREGFSGAYAKKVQ
ncbi:MAG: protein kinase [Coriobacteriia bacterium]|nr:protein kinase [Coriobacteriia bacterium]